MSEHLDNSKFRKAKLKELILKLHHGESQDSVRQELLVSLSNIPYGEVLEVEQELIAEGLPEEEVFDLCDAHTAVLYGTVDLSASKSVPRSSGGCFTGRKQYILKNPILKRTVAKIATLQQAAAIGGVKTEELINRLRKEVGQDSISGEVGSQYNYQKPGWFTADKIVKWFNASEMLAA